MKVVLLVLLLLLLLSPAAALGVSLFQFRFPLPPLCVTLHSVKLSWTPRVVATFFIMQHWRNECVALERKGHNSAFGVTSCATVGVLMTTVRWRSSGCPSLSPRNARLFRWTCG